MDDSRRQSELKSLEKQGHMMREVTPDGAYIWSKAVQTLPAEQMKFVLNSAVDMLPHTTYGRRNQMTPALSVESGKPNPGPYSEQLQSGL